MKRICFGKNITAVNNTMTHLTTNIKDSLREVYRFPQNLVDISNCFNSCSNFTKFEAELPNTVINMSSSFGRCVNFYKNVSIPSNCIDMSNSFRDTKVKGSFKIPNTVNNMDNSFRSSGISDVLFEGGNESLYSMNSSFLNCQSLSSVRGNLPSDIEYAYDAFRKTGIKEVNFLGANSHIHDSDYLFADCPNLEQVVDDLNGNWFYYTFLNCGNLKDVKNIKCNQTFSGTFKNCKKLENVGNVSGNGFTSMWQGCSNLKSIGNINGKLNFNNTFNGCDNYSDVVYLNPSSLSMGAVDQNFLNSHPLRIYGTGHGIENELNFQNAHVDKGDYISGYCDPDDYDVKNGNQFTNYKGSSNIVVIRPYYRTNLLDASTKKQIDSYNAFSNKTFNSIYMVEGEYPKNAFNDSFCNSTIDNEIITYGNIHANAFKNSNITNFLGKNVQKVEQCAFEGASINNISIEKRSSATYLDVGVNAFRNTKNVENFNISPVDYVYNNAFRDSNIKFHFDNNLNSFYFLRSIYSYAFCNASGITFSNEAFNGTKNIYAYAFYNSSITSLNLPDSVNLVANSLYGMNNLTNLNTNLFSKDYFYTCPPNLKNVELRGNSYSSVNTRFLTSVENITMTNSSILSLAPSQFYGLQNLKTLKVNKNLLSLGDSVFYDCTNLRSVTNLQNYKVQFDTSGNYTFYNCKSLKSIRINSFTNQNVGQSLIAGCDSLEEFYYHDYGSHNVVGNYLLAQYQTGGKTHAARFFNAIEYYDFSQSNINLYGLTTASYFDSNYTSQHCYAYLNTKRVPKTLKTIRGTGITYTSYTFAGLNNVENIGMSSGEIARHASEACNMNYVSTVAGCNSLKNLDISVGYDMNNPTRKLSVDRIGIPSSVVNSVNTTISYPYN